MYNLKVYGTTFEKDEFECYRCNTKKGKKIIRSLNQSFIILGSI